MRKLVVIALLAASAFAAPPKAAAPKPGSDQFAIESTVLAVYNVISGPAGRRDWDRFASSDDKPFARGINSFQLVRSGDDWRVLRIFWEEEDAAYPIPAQYLPKR